MDNTINQTTKTAGYTAKAAPTQDAQKQKTDNGCSAKSCASCSGCSTKNNKKSSTKKAPLKINEWKRHTVQALWAFLTNSHISGFFTGKIYTGKLKNVCVPGLNCYSCPGAVGACPIGSIQAVVCHWISDLYRSSDWKTRMRLSLSVRSDPGSAPQDPVPEKNTHVSGR